MTSSPSGVARVCVTAMLCGMTFASTRSTASLGALLTRRISVIASATAVASSSNDEPAVASPVRSVTTVWKLSSASRRPWLISGWYGV